jgi:hypothetical protein
MVTIGRGAHLSALFAEGWDSSALSVWAFGIRTIHPQWTAGSSPGFQPPFILGSFITPRLTQFLQWSSGRLPAVRNLLSCAAVIG